MELKPKRFRVYFIVEGLTTEPINDFKLVNFKSAIFHVTYAKDKESAGKDIIQWMTPYRTTVRKIIEIPENEICFYSGIKRIYTQPNIRHVLYEKVFDNYMGERACG